MHNNVNKQRYVQQLFSIPKSRRKRQKTLKTVLTGCGQVTIIILNDVHIEVIE